MWMRTSALVCCGVTADQNLMICYTLLMFSLIYDVVVWSVCFRGCSQAVTALISLLVNVCIV